ncbi:hypothetical protein [Algoriphagus sp.]|uniref:hypothetical protein n=1 Tax=Algoriphagus sp. TaxID=1872435 RepID=UPI0025F08D54|nr:hypothetical protein [Algoriphagus sp.]
MRGMKERNRNSKLFQQRITVMLALLFCLFISSVEYIPESSNIISQEQQDNQPDQDQNQTFLNGAVDAVVPFVVHVSHTVLYLIYQIEQESNPGFHIEVSTLPHPNQLVEILFERIISTKGP